LPLIWDKKRFEEKEKFCNRVKGLVNTIEGRGKMSGIDMSKEYEKMDNDTIGQLDAENVMLRDLLALCYRRFRFIGLGKKSLLLSKLTAILGDNAEKDYLACTENLISETLDP
jgi:hypothetical protein